MMMNLIDLLMPVGVIIDLIINCGFVSGSNFDGHPRNNSSKKIARNNIIQNVLKSNLNTLLEESRALEDEIYSEVYNLQKNMENKQGTNTGLKYYKNDLNLSEIKYKKNRKLENKNNLQKFTKSTNSGEHFSQNDIHNLKFANEFMNVSGDLLLNKNEYFLGFSGNPFEVHEGKYDVFELLKPEKNSFGKVISDPRQKRSVLHLYSMVLCATGCNPITYKGYGCYCGFLGSGYVADGIDSCCKMHDRCYNTAGCPTFLEYFIPYLWKCYSHQPLCAIDHGSYGGPGSCAQRLCECDRRLSLCLKRYPCPTTKAFCTSSPWRLLQNILTL